MKKLLLGLALGALACSPALADYLVKTGDGSTITIFDYVVGGKHYGVHVNVDNSGAPIGVPGNPFAVDTVVRATAADRGAVIGFTGTSGSATTASTSLTTATMTAGAPIVGQIISATGIAAGTTITAISGSSPTYTLTLSAAATVSAGAAIASGGPQQIMALNSSRRGFSAQVQSTTSYCYLGSSVTADFHSLQLAPGAYFETAPTHSGTAAIAALCTIAATPLYAREY